LVEDQVSLTLWPETTEVGLAVIETVGAVAAIAGATLTPATSAIAAARPLRVCATPGRAMR
jgi:hypothetical protein